MLAQLYSKGEKHDYSGNSGTGGLWPFAIQMKRLWIELAGKSFDLRDADLIHSRSKDLAGAQISRTMSVR